MTTGADRRPRCPGERRRGPEARPPSSVPAAWPAALGALLLLAAVAACAGSRRGVDRAPANTVAFLFDRSSSVDGRLLLSARELTRRRLGALTPGDRLMVWSLDGDELESRSWRVPEAGPEGEGFLGEVRERVVAVTDTAPYERRPGTKLLRALEELAEEIEHSPETGTVVYLFSDMLQVGSGLNFEAPDSEAPRAWVSEKTAAGDLPDLRGLCVVVVGPREDTVRDRNVRAFWEAYFRAAGADLAPENYAARMSRLPESPCPSPPGPGPGP